MSLGESKGDPNNLVCVYCVAQFPHEETDNCKPPVGMIEEIVAASNVLGRPPSDASEMKDALSTGRKRAAASATIQVGDICEWALLKEAGGGVEPIVGCPGNPAEHLHHGPDKNTLNNNREEGTNWNLHKVCTYCHNRWHGKNNKHYEGDRPKDDTPWVPVGDWKLHNSELKMSRKEALMQEMLRAKN